MTEGVGAGSQSGVSASSMVLPRGFRLLCCLVALLQGSLSVAADPQPYSVGIVPTGQAELDQAVTDSSILLELREKAPVGPFGLIARAREDVERFTTALRSFGFYEGSVSLLIDGRTLDDPELPELLLHYPPRPVRVAVFVRPGPLFHLRKVEIKGRVSDTARRKLQLTAGEPALAPKVLEARDNLLTALQQEGHALAKVGEPEAILDKTADVLDVTFPVDAGPKVTLGQISLKGLERMQERFVRRRLLVRSGQRFDPVEIETARRDLASLGVFASVGVKSAEVLDGQGNLPLTFALKEKARHAVSLNAAYSTDLGGSLATTWQNVNLLGQAERLGLTAGVAQLGGSSSQGIGYHVSSTFLKPDFLLRDQSLQGDVGALKQSLIAYDQKAFTGGVQLNRKVFDHWSYSIGLAGEQSQITQEGIKRDYTLLGLPLLLKYDDSNSLLDPTRGLRATLSVTPTQPLAGPASSPFVLLQISASAYWDLAAPGRSVLALRGLLGDAEGASQFELPPTKRYYAGGSATVRGFKYQSIGPQFRKDRPQGGTTVAAGTIEFRQRIREHYGVVAFADAGQVNAGGTPFADTWRIGAGLGARYYSSFGPIRLDVAMPVNKLPGGSAFELYIGIGQAF